jgi:hypothetical protein
MDRAQAAWELFENLTQRERAQFMRSLKDWQAERQADRQADRTRNGNSRGPTLLSELSVSAADLAG